MCSHGCWVNCTWISPPGWLSGEHVGLMTWWLWVRNPVEANFLSGVFSPLTSAQAWEKSSWWLWKESCVSSGVWKPGNMCITNHHDMTLAAKLALNPNTSTTICPSHQSLWYQRRFQHGSVLSVGFVTWRLLESRRTGSSGFFMRVSLGKTL